MDDTSSEHVMEQSSPSTLELVVEQSHSPIPPMQEQPPQPSPAPAATYQAQVYPQIPSSREDEKKSSRKMNTEMIDGLLLFLHDKDPQKAFALKTYIDKNNVDINQARIESALSLYTRKPSELQSKGISLRIIADINEFYQTTYGAKYASDELLNTVRVPVNKGALKPSTPPVPRSYQPRQRRGTMSYGPTLQNEIRASKLEALTENQRMVLRSHFSSFLESIEKSYPHASSEIKEYTSKHEMKRIEDLYIEVAAKLASDGLSLGAISAINLVFKEKYDIVWISEMPRQAQSPRVSAPAAPAASQNSVSANTEERRLTSSSLETYVSHISGSAPPHSIMESMPRSRHYNK